MNFKIIDHIRSHLIDKVEAGEILSLYEGRFKTRTYEELKRLLRLQDVETFEHIGASGKAYQLEAEAFWDDDQAGHLRVVIRIHQEGGWSVFLPMSTDFIVAPDGHFVGE